MNPTPSVKPWYRHPWVWALITIPVLSVAISFGLMWTAIKNQDPEVQGDWYKQGKAINQDFARDDYASALTISAELTLTGQQLRTVIRSPYTLDKQALPASLQLVLSHPTDDKRDETVTLQRQPDASYQGLLARPVTGRYYLTLSTPAWRLSDTVFFPLDQQPFVLKPAAPK